MSEDHGDTLGDESPTFGVKRGASLADGTSLEVVPRLIELLVGAKTPTVDVRGSQDVRLNDLHVSELVGAILTNNGEVPVTELSLQYHHISDDGATDIVRLLENANSSLTSLNLEGNSIGAAGAAAVAGAIERDDCGLRHLNLSWNNLGTEGGQSIAGALDSNNSLRVLKLANCGFTYAPLIALYTALKNHPRLEELDVDRPVFAKYDSDICADHLSIALLNHPSLRRLSARYHRVSDYGASLISRSLISRVNIVSLNLSCNMIGVEGAEHLASFIVQSLVIEEVSLANNTISDEGALAMSKALRSSNSLKVLLLQNNNIRVAGLTAIGNAMAKNNTLQKPFLWGNAFDPTAGELYHELCINRFPYTGLQLDFTTYVVDGVHLVAEIA